MSENKLDLALDDIVMRDSKKPGHRRAPNFRFNRKTAISKTVPRSKPATGFKPKRSGPFAASVAQIEKRIAQNQTKNPKIVNLIRENNVEAKPRRITLRGEGGPATIVISNIHEKVKTEDIRTVFKKYGEIQKCILFFNENGKSVGICEVTYKLKKNAEDAIKNMNDVIADGNSADVIIAGRRLKVTYKEHSSAKPAARPTPFKSS